MKQIKVKDKNGKEVKAIQFIIEEYHPAIGNYLIVDGKKYRVSEENFASGKLVRPFQEGDEELIREYDEAIDTISEKLKDRLDIKRMISENLKNQTLAELKTGLYILEEQEKGSKVQEEHHKGCYHYKIHLGGKTFEFATGSDVFNGR